MAKEGQTLYPVGVTRQLCDGLSCSTIPQGNCIISTCTGEQAPIGAHGKGLEGVAVALQPLDTATAGDIPDSNRVVIAAAGQ